MKKSDRHQIVCNMSLKLLQFLIENKVLTKYVNNTLRFNQTTNVRDEYNEDYRDIAHAFIWKETPEGVQFWDKLSNELEYEEL